MLIELLRLEKLLLATELRFTKAPKLAHDTGKLPAGELCDLCEFQRQPSFCSPTPSPPPKEICIPLPPDNVCPTLFDWVNPRRFMTID